MVLFGVLHLAIALLLAGKAVPAGFLAHTPPSELLRGPGSFWNCASDEDGRHPAHGRTASLFLCPGHRDMYRPSWLSPCRLQGFVRDGVRNATGGTGLAASPKSSPWGPADGIYWAMDSYPAGPGTDKTLFHPATRITETGSASSTSRKLHTSFKNRASSERTEHPSGGGQGYLQQGEQGCLQAVERTRL